MGVVRVVTLCEPVMLEHAGPNVLYSFFLDGPDLISALKISGM